MIVSAFITALVSKFPHSYTSAEVVAWINEVDRNVCPDADKNYLAAYYNRVANTSNIAYLAGVEFEDIESLTVDGHKHWPVDLRTSSSLLHYYYDDNGKIEIRPVPTVSDTARLSGANEITFATNTITTTGDDFSGFVVGDIITISGCLLATANNKNATVTAVAAKVLTVNPATFTGQAEAAAITIKAPKIKLVYLAKTTDNAGDEPGLASELKIPKRFQDIYQYYLMAQMSLVRKEFSDYNNYITLYNSRAFEYEQWYQSRAGVTPESNVIMDGGWGYHAAANFDTDQR